MSVLGGSNEGCAHLLRQLGADARGRAGDEDNAVATLQLLASPQMCPAAVATLDMIPQRSSGDSDEEQCPKHRRQCG